MLEPDYDDTHLCIKCSTTIVGLANYIQHRKQNCGNVIASSLEHKHASSGESEKQSSTKVSLNHPYDSFAFSETEAPSTYVSKSNDHSQKASKSLNDVYDLAYELGADVFFSSLQLQSVQSIGPSTSGKSGSQQLAHLSRQKSASISQPVHTEDEWIGAHASPNRLRVRTDLAKTKNPYGNLFESISYEQNSPRSSDDDINVGIEDDDEAYDALEAAHASGGKWKLPLVAHSPPVVPEGHTGGKWKPEHRPNLHDVHTQLTRLSPNWEEQADDVEAADTTADQHPPAGHTKGKWIPGSELQPSEYNANEEPAVPNKRREYWCNICCRRLKSKSIYENHLKTSYHQRRAEPEQQLEKAMFAELQPEDMSFLLDEPETHPAQELATSKKRKRRKKYIKCKLCKHTVLPHLIGKHLISHYHYRRMQTNPSKSLRMILDNIHSIVTQSPFQCRPCSFYANTEKAFLLHWSSGEHLEACKGPGVFWCSFCQYKCEDNSQMHSHLLSKEHKQVIWVINRSVPIFIYKKLEINCDECHESFRYNAELRKHLRLCHPLAECIGTASQLYQSKFQCSICGEILRSKVALQRHEKNKHEILKFFCSICRLEFDSPCKARRHRKTLDHRRHATLAAEKSDVKKRKAVQGTTTNRKAECSTSDTMVEDILHELSNPKVVLTDLPKVTERTFLRKPSKKEHTSTKISALKKRSTAPLKCKDCDVVCATLSELKTHRDSEHPLLRHVCMSCGESFALAQGLGRHARNCQPTPTTSMAKSKATEDDPETSWNCDKCYFKAPLKSELIYHQLHHNFGPLGKNELIKCPLCNKCFRKHSLRCHLRQHTDEKIFECEFCQAKFSRRQNLKTHVSYLHTRKSPDDDESGQPSEKHQCETCRKVFANPYSLKTHNLTHGERQYRCSHEGCNYFTVSTALLKVHLVSHSKEKFECYQMGCKYVGRSLLHLKRHSQSHIEPTKLYGCDQCDFTARIKGHIERHMRTHSGEKPFMCPYCDFRCSCFDNLRKHVLKTNKHVGRFIYECELCETETAAVFKTNSHQEFMQHIKNHTA